MLGLFFVALAWWSYVWIKPKYDPWGAPLWAVGRELDRIAPSGALVAVADVGDPTAMYYSRRKGWHFLENFGIAAQDDAHAIRELEQLRQRGAGYLAFTRYSFWWLDYYPGFRAYLDPHCRRVRETDDYIIYNISGPQK
jgi:hypothetical protein